MSTGVRWMSLAASLGLGWALAAGAQERLDEMATIGEEHMRSGNYGAAIKLYEDIVSHPTYENILPVKFDLAWAYYLTGAFEKAIPLFSDMASVRAPSEAVKAQSLFLLADCHARLAAQLEAADPARQTHIETSIELHTKFQTQNPQSPNVPQSLYGRGYAYFLSRRFVEAEADLNALIQKYPQASASQDAFFLLGSVYSQQALDLSQAGKKAEAQPFRDKAKVIFDQLAKREGNPVTANESLFALAETWFNAGFYDEAIETYRDVRPKQEVVQILRAQAEKVQAQLAAQVSRQEDTSFSKSEMDRLKAQLAAVSEGADLMVAGYLRMAQAYFERGWYDVCRAICRHLMAFGDADRRQQAYYLLINTHLQEGDPARAAEEFDGFQQTFGADAPIADTVSLSISQLYMMQGGEEGMALSLAQLTKGLEEYPEGRGLEEMLHLKFLAEYALDRPEACIATADAYMAKYPEGVHTPMALYYKAMSQSALDQVEEALATLDQAITRFPEKTEQYTAVDEVYYQKAPLLLRANKAEEAVKHLEAFPARFPDSALRPEARFQLGVAWNGAGQPGKAREALESIARDFPDHRIVPNALFQIAVMAYEVKDWPRMADALEVLLAACPESARTTDAYFWLGYIARQDAQYDEAIDYYTRCVESDPAFDQAPECLLAAAQCRKEKADKMGLPVMMSEANRAVHRQTMWDAAFGFEDVLLNYPDADAAQEAILGMAQAVYDLVRLKQIDEAGAEGFFAAALGRAQNNPSLGARLSFAQGNFRVLNKQTAPAMEAFQRAFSLQPDAHFSPTLLASYAEALKEAEAPAEAERIYNRIIAENPDNPRALAPAWFGLADIKFRQKDFEAATPAFEKVLNDYPWYQDGKLGRVKLAEIYELQQDYAKAEAMFAEVWKQEQGEARLGAMLGVARCQLAQVRGDPRPGNWREIIRISTENLTKITVLFEAFTDYCAEAYYLLGEACELNGEPDKAKEMYYRVTADYKNYPVAQRAAARLQALGGYTPPAPAAP